MKKLQCPFKKRAISVEAKLERRNQILHAAEELVKRHGHSAISVAEVAKRARVAKGTVYLYFKTKEEVYLGLHQNWLDRKFDAFTNLIQDTSKEVTGVIIGSTIADIMLSEPHGLVIATTCHSLMETNIQADAAIDFKLKLAQRLSKLGEMCELRFPQLSSGSGARLLVQAYAMTLGLWQLMDTNSQWRKIEKTKGMEVFNREFSAELHDALIALWRGALEIQ